MRAEEGMDMNGATGWEGAAIKTIREALEGCSRPCAVYTGDRQGDVLMHMLRRARGGVPGMPVLFVQPKGLGPDVLKHMDKLRRIWRLDAVYVRPAAGDGEGEAGALKAAARAAARLGADCMVTPFGTSADAAGGIRSISPLQDADPEEIGGYAAAHGLPESPAGAAEVRDDAEVAEKLRSLGYM